VYFQTWQATQGAFHEIYNEPIKERVIEEPVRRLGARVP
jgi:hypothetical protein